MGTRTRTPSSTPDAITVHVINAYAPTSEAGTRDHTHHDLVDAFNHTLETLVLEVPVQPDTVLFLCGDFNGRLGTRQCDSERHVLGSHSKGTRNAQGSRLLEFMLEHELFTTGARLATPSPTSSPRSTSSCAVWASGAICVVPAPTAPPWGTWGRRRPTWATLRRITAW